MLLFCFVSFRFVSLFFSLFVRLFFCLFVYLFLCSFVVIGFGVVGSGGAVVLVVVVDVGCCC